MNDQEKKTIELLLPSIRSVHNVGSIFRTADAMGVKKITLTGVTPAPIDRFGRERNDLSKVSLGAHNSVPWEQLEGDMIAVTVEYISQKKSDGYLIVVLEQHSRSVPIQSGGWNKKGGILLIVGNEVDGVSEEISDLADVIVEIDMLGKKESLNVSVSTGIALYALRNE